MIKSFRHAGLEKFFRKNIKSGIVALHAPRLNRQLTALNAASAAAQMNLPGWGLHALKGDLKGHWSVSVNGNWRLIFTFDGEDAILVDYRDYH